MRTALREFDRALRDADAGLFFYAGHGMEYQGRNYLFPTDAVLESEGDVGLGLIDVSQVLHIMETRVPTRLLFLDACRNNPLARRFRSALGTTRSTTVGKGLARIDAAVGTFIAYATAPGKLAEDGKGDNSPFSAAMLRHLDEPGLDVGELMRKVRNTVLEATNERQIPWNSSSLRGSFVINIDVTIALNPDPTAADSTTLDRQADILFWESIKDSDQVSTFEAYLQRFGDEGLFAPLASLRIEALNSESKTAGHESKRESAEQSLLLEPKVEALDSGFEPEIFNDCEECPDMVVIPAGTFTMGSSSGDIDRSSDEEPEHHVAIKSFALSRNEITRLEYSRFVRATGHIGKGCRSRIVDGWVSNDQFDWSSVGFEQSDEHPATCISWDDAKAFVSWLSEISNESYRLPSESEWEYAARGNNRSVYYWGDSGDNSCAFANGYDQTAVSEVTLGWKPLICDDGYAHTAPVGSFASNPFSLNDMSGNVWEWVEDRYHENYSSAPRDGTAWTAGTRDVRVRRGGAWVNGVKSMRSAMRAKDQAHKRSNHVGMRVARDFSVN